MVCERCIYIYISDLYIYDIYIHTNAIKFITVSQTSLSHTFLVTMR